MTISLLDISPLDAANGRGKLHFEENSMGQDAKESINQRSPSPQLAAVCSLSPRCNQPVKTEKSEMRRRYQLTLGSTGEHWWQLLLMTLNESAGGTSVSSGERMRTLATFEVEGSVLFRPRCDASITSQQTLSQGEAKPTITCVI